MPRRDKTGPLGRGAMTGGGYGLCSVGKGVNYGAGLGFGRGLGLGLGCRRGFGRNGANDPNTILKTHKELLTEQKELLANRLDRISKQLDSL